MTVKEQILLMLQEVENLLLTTECDGKKLADLECFEEVDVALAHLVQTVDYYVD